MTPAIATTKLENRPGNPETANDLNKAVTAAAARIATARGGVAKAKQDYEKVFAQSHAFEASCARLEAQQQEATKHLGAARMQLQADQEQLIALEAIGEFAASDVTIAECELALAQAKAHVAAFDRAKDTSRASGERASLEQKVKDTEDRLVEEKERLGYNDLQKKHEEAKTKLKGAKGKHETVEMIATLEKEVTAVQGKIGRKDSELNSLKDQQGKLVSEAEQFKAQVKTLEEKIGGLKQNLEQTKATVPAERAEAETQPSERAGTVAASPVRVS